jgi:hypothetical protein
MSDHEEVPPIGIGHNGGPALDLDSPVPFDDWFDAKVRKPSGEVYGHRQKLNFIKRYRLPVIKVGWATLIVPRAGNEQIAKYAMHQEPARRRGRPRMVV